MEILFGCKHRFGFPISRRGTAIVYQVCLDCGAEFEYNWRTMRRGRQMDQVITLGKKPAGSVHPSKVVAA